jgi:cytochrome c peroxidase
LDGAQRAGAAESSTVVPSTAESSGSGPSAAESTPQSSASSAPFYANTFAKPPSAAALTELGRALFFDPALSASGKLACASCHDPHAAFGPSNDLAVQRGGGDGRHHGVRSVPSLMYAQNVPPFTAHFVDDDGDDSVDQGPAGGRTWDGRAQSAHEQASLPLLSPFEMANPDLTAVVSKVASAGYAGKFRAAFGKRIFATPAAAFKGVLMALEAYQQNPQEFYPYSSKYDAWLRHETALSDQEMRGLAAFNDPSKGNCARCHPSAMRRGAFPQFTDFGFAAIGAPRNPNIPANADRNYHDLGLCGPWRTDLRERSEYCGLFRTPTLRNVATRRVFLHNGVFHRLQDVVRFYAQRDTQPGEWYPHSAAGAVDKFDDLPRPFSGNVDIQPPFDRQPGQPPALTESDIADIVVFLQTLTDGYQRGPRSREHPLCDPRPGRPTVEIDPQSGHLPT